MQENEIIGKTSHHIISKIQNVDSNWSDFFHQIAQHKSNIVFEHYHLLSSKRYKVHASSSEKGFFTTIFEELNLNNEGLRKRDILNKTLHLTKHSIDSIRDSIFWINKNANIIYVNEAVCRNLQYSEQELLSMWVFDVDPIFPKENWENHWESIIKEGSITIETIHRQKSGLEIPVEVTTNLVEFEGVKYNCAVARDISKRKLAEEYLKNIENQFEAVFEKAADALFIADAHTGIILKANHTASKLLLKPIDDIIGMHQSQLHPSQNKE